MLDVVGFGAINLDTIYHVDSLSAISVNGVDLLPGREFSADSETFSKVMGAVKKCGRMKMESGGGSAANTVVALSRMGFQTGLVGKIGDDPEGEKVRAEMKAVDLGGVVSEGKSGRCLCILDSRQDRFMVLETNTNDTLSAEEIDYQFAIDARYLHLTSFIGERPFHAQCALADRIKPPTEISFDPGEVYAGRGLDYLMPLFHESAIVFLTDHEVRMLTGLDYLEGSSRLLELGPSAVVCKRGERGVHVLSRKERFGLPAEPRTVIDNTGAGDVFNAGFLAGLLRNRSLWECARFATRIASHSVTGYGRSTYPAREDLTFLEP